MSTDMPIDHLASGGLPAKPLLAAAISVKVFPEQEINVDLERAASSRATSLATINRRKHPNMTDEERMAAYQMLLIKLKPGASGRLQRGALKDVAELFGVTSKTISKLWKRAQESLAIGKLVASVLSKMTRRVGRKKKMIIVRANKAIPLSLRQNERSLAVQLNMSTLHRRIAEGQVKAHTNAINKNRT